MKISIIFFLCAVLWDSNALDCIDGVGPGRAEPKSVKCPSDTDMCFSLKFNIIWVKRCVDEKESETVCEGFQKGKLCYVCDKPNCNKGDEAA